MKKPKPEPEEPTVLCVAPKPAIIDRSTIVRCQDCNVEVWRGKLCYQHFRESQGFEFDEEQKLFVKRKK